MDEMSFDYMFHIERKLDLRDNKKPFSINFHITTYWINKKQSFICSKLLDFLYMRRFISQQINRQRQLFNNWCHKIEIESEDFWPTKIKSGINNPNHNLNHKKKVIEMGQRPMTTESNRQQQLLAAKNRSCFHTYQVLSSWVSQVR